MLISVLNYVKSIPDDASTIFLSSRNFKICLDEKKVFFFFKTIVVGLRGCQAKYHKKKICLKNLNPMANKISP